MMLHTRLPLLLLLNALALTPPCLAQQVHPSPHREQTAEETLPQWEALSNEQRALLIAPLRERWNANPQARQRMWRHAQRWHELAPHERRRAQRGAHRLEHLNPREREQMRALFERIRGMPQQQRHETMLLFRHMRYLPHAEREALVQRWHTMTAEQRTQWLRDHTSPGHR